jgi:hypothetical protein
MVGHTIRLEPGGTPNFLFRNFDLVSQEKLQTWRLPEIG